MELLQEEVREECTGVHHHVQNDGHHARFLFQDPIFSPQVSRGYTRPGIQEIS
jgi:hypothetical protein